MSAPIPSKSDEASIGHQRPSPTAPDMLTRRSPPQSRRDRWLAELTDALEQAHLLTLEVGGYSDIACLTNRIQSVQQQIAGLRSGAVEAIGADDPIWSLLPHWRGNREG